MADRHSGAILAWHLRADWNDTVPKKALLKGCDYVVPFLTKFPTYSWSVVCAPATNISDEELSDQGGLVFDVELFAYQTTAVQRLKLTSYMCLPPETSWTDPTPSVRLERLVSAQSAHVSEIGSDDANPDVEFDEAYDLEEDDEEEEIEAPDPSSLPSPLGIGNSTPSLSNNPFANWLGTIASKTTTSVPPAVVAAPAHVPPPASSLPTPPPDQPKKIVLSKHDLEDPKKVEPQNAAPVMTTKGPNNISNADSKKKKKVKATPVPPSAPEVGKVSILRRDDEVKPSLLLDSGANIPPSPTNPIEASMDTKSIAEDIRKVVHHEMRSTLVPALKQAVQESLNTSVINPIQASITQLSKQVVMNDNMESALSGSVEEPLQAAVANTMRTVLIPTMESITNQVFVRVSESLERTAATTSTDSKKELEAISLQLTTMTALVAELTNEVQSLRKLVRSNQAPVPPAPTAPSLPPINPVEALRKEIAALIQQRQYEAAFTKAVSSSTAELAVFACTNSNLTSVLGSARVELSQRILICLMQQLSTVLNWRDASLNVPLILEWLQEIALSLDPNDDTIKRHIPTVLQQMVSSVNNRMSLDEPVLRRPLQKLLQILRGMSIS
jgi:enhancer of mRNA-decapping protein 4